MVNLKLVPKEWRIEGHPFHADLIIRSIRQRQGPDKFGVYYGSLILNKFEKTFDYEVLPSSRNEEFEKTYRFNTLEEALQFVENSIPPE